MNYNFICMTCIYSIAGELVLFGRNDWEFVLMEMHSSKA